MHTGAFSTAYLVFRANVRSKKLKFSVDAKTLHFFTKYNPKTGVFLVQDFIFAQPQNSLD